MNDVHQAAQGFEMTMPMMMAIGAVLLEHIDTEDLVSWRMRDSESKVLMTIAVSKYEGNGNEQQ